MTDLILARARLLCLLRDYDRASKARRVPRKLEADLKSQRAAVLALEVRHG